MRPRLLLIHGFLSGPGSWRPLQRHLEGAADTIAPELAGYGAAPGPRAAEYSLDALADSLEPVVEREGPTHILGHSMGAIVALELARRHPRRFEGVGVLGLPVFADRAEALAFLHRRGLAHRLLLRSDATTHVLCRALFAARWAWTPLVPWIAPGSPVAHIHGAFRHSHGGHGGALDGVVFAGHVPRLAGALSGPVVALHGADDRAAPPDRARAVAEEHGWAFTMTASGRHQLMVTRPRVVARWARSALLVPGARPARPGEDFSEPQSPPTLER